MTVKRLYTQSELIIKDPYIIRVSFETVSNDSAGYLHRQLVKKTRDIVTATWGYTDGNYETVSSFDPKSPFATIMDYRAYYAFSDGQDALGFSLGLKYAHKRVIMWPKHLLFTIHEFVTE